MNKGDREIEWRLVRNSIFKIKQGIFTMKIFRQILIALLEQADWREGKGVEI
jgi:hypothetical protein